MEEFFKLPNMFPSYNFYVVGEGNLKAKIPDKINYLGYQYQIEPMIAGFDLIIAPKEKEGFGRVLVESMIQGTPVIASKIPAHIEITKNGKYAILANKAKAKNIGSAINYYFLNKKNIKKKSEAQVYAINSFSLKSHIAQIEKIYKTLLH